MLELCQRCRSSLVPIFILLLDTPVESLRLIFLLLQSKLPPSCGEVSSTIFFNTPVMFAPDPTKLVAVTTPEITCGPPTI